MTKRILFLLALCSLAGCQSTLAPTAPPAVQSDPYQTQHQPSIGHLKQPLDRHKGKWYDKHGFVLVPALEIARFQLSVRPDAPPEAWDAATLTLTSPDPLVPPVSRTLYQGSDLLALDGSFQAADSSLPELMPGDYTVTLSLWRDGPAGTLVGEDQQDVTLVNGSNTLELKPSTLATLGLKDFAPTSAAPGATVSLVGQGFSVLPAQNLVTIGGSAVPVVSASSTQLDVVAPNLPPGSYAVWVQVGGGMVGRLGFTITAP